MRIDMDVQGAEQLARWGILPIHGSRPEPEGEPAGQDGGGDGEPAGEGDPAAEEDPAAEGDPQAEGDPGEGDGDPERDPQRQPGEFDPQGGEGGPSRSEARIRELLDANRTLTRQLEIQQDQVGAREGRRDGRGGTELPAELQEADKHLRPYMLHYLQPLAQGYRALEGQLQDLVDQVTPRQLGIMENAMTALRQRYDGITRVDVLRYLRGHQTYAKDFAEQPDPGSRVQRDLVAGRRQAGQVAGRQAATGRGAGDGKIDLAKMTREQRIKHFETVEADTAF
jgi:hypothetical protein